MCFFFPAAHQESIIVSLYNYPSFGRTDLTMCTGERLTIISEYVMQLMFHLDPHCHIDTYN